MGCFDRSCSYSSLLLQVSLLFINSVYLNVYFSELCSDWTFGTELLRPLRKHMCSSADLRSVVQSTAGRWLLSQRSTIAGRRTIREKEGQEPRTHWQIDDGMKCSILNLTEHFQSLRSGRTHQTHEGRSGIMLLFTTMTNDTPKKKKKTLLFK